MVFSLYSVWALSIRLFVTKVTKTIETTYSTVHNCLPFPLASLSFVNLQIWQTYILTHHKRIKRTVTLAHKIAGAMSSNLNMLCELNPQRNPMKMLLFGRAFCILSFIRNWILIIIILLLWPRLKNEHELANENLIKHAKINRDVWSWSSFLLFFSFTLMCLIWCSLANHSLKSSIIYLQWNCIWSCDCITRLMTIIDAIIDALHLTFFRLRQSYIYNYKYNL